MHRFLQGTMQRYFSFTHRKMLKGAGVTLLFLVSLFLFWSWIEPGESAVYKEFETASVKREFNFIHYDQNELQYFGKKEIWNSFFQKLDHLVFDGEGKISIVHIGGSHVQGGALTDRMRSNFSRLTNGTEGERGFVSPYKLAGTNSPK